MLILNGSVTQDSGEWSPTAFNPCLEAFWYFGLTPKYSHLFLTLMHPSWQNDVSKPIGNNVSKPIWNNAVTSWTWNSKVCMGKARVKEVPCCMVLSIQNRSQPHLMVFKRWGKRVIVVKWLMPQPYELQHSSCWLWVRRLWWVAAFSGSCSGIC